jgi:hypothetical protein
MGRGQLANHVTLVTKKPKVGDGVTIFHWSDRSAGTVSRVHPGGMKAWFRYDHSFRTDHNGKSESQSYRYEQRPDSPEYEVSLRKNGEWRCVGRHGSKVVFGVRAAYHDFSF